MLTRTLPEGLGGQIGGDRKADESCVLDRLRRAPNQPDRLSIEQEIRPATWLRAFALPLRRICQFMWYRPIELAMLRDSEMAPNHEGFSMGTKRSTHPIAHPFCARPNGFRRPVTNDSPGRTGGRSWHSTTELLPRSVKSAI